VEWGGALRWLRSDEPPDSIRAIAKAAGGHATQFRCGSGRRPVDGVFTPLDPVAMRVHRRLKRAFDPARILNPGRLYPQLAERSR
jgi:glycolate oxidase FAD binding subunit